MTIENVKSKYSKRFDKNCVPWSKDNYCNWAFLKHQENYANDILRNRGHIFLNEVYDMLGLRRTEEGCVVGWFYKEGDTTRDNRVEFGIPKEHTDELEYYDLDFNVDGYIADLI